MSEPRPGWLEQSLNAARTNIEVRPEHLKPERYRRCPDTQLMVPECSCPKHIRAMLAEHGEDAS